MRKYFERYCDNIEKVENYEEAKRKMSESHKGNHSNKGQHWKLVDGKRVWY